MWYGKGARRARLEQIITQQHRCADLQSEVASRNKLRCGAPRKTDSSEGKIGKLVTALAQTGVLEQAYLLSLQPVVKGEHVVLADSVGLVIKLS